jgi:hypothetical protein
MNAPHDLVLVHELEAVAALAPGARAALIELADALEQEAENIRSRRSPDASPAGVSVRRSPLSCK